MKKRYLYVALGDSITGGLLASLLCGFAHRFCEFLKYKCCAVCKNFGCPGLTSCGLLRQLCESEEVMDCVQRAEVITITIGGVNLLKASECNYRAINRKEADRWVRQFSKDWPRILCRIREEICSDAQIFVMNLYNPYCQCDPNYEVADYYIDRINCIISDQGLIDTYCYTVVDVYSCFEKNKCKDWTFCNNFIIRDLHPNWEGHRQIFLRFKKAFCEENKFM